MQKEIMLTPMSANPAVEAYITNLEAELTDFAKLQAKEDALKESEITEPLFNIKVKEFVQSKVQAGIDFIKGILLLPSMIFDAAEIDRAAQRKIQQIHNEINDRLQVLASLKRKLHTLVLDPLKMKYSKWLTFVALAIGIGDAMLAYTSFRHGSYTVIQALLAALAIGAAISVSHLLYAGWIKQSKTEIHRKVKILLILIIAFAFFGWLGNLRAEAANDTVNIALDGPNVTAVSNPHFNGWAIAIISFILFAVVLFLSLLLWKTKEERLKEQEHCRVRKEILTIQEEIKNLEGEKVDTENNAALQKSEARKVYDYYMSSIRKCKSIGINAITKYKQTYARFHNDMVPMFFATPCDLSYDESFNFLKTPKPEPV